MKFNLDLKMPFEIFKNNFRDLNNVIAWQLLSSLFLVIFGVMIIFPLVAKNYILATIAIILFIVFAFMLVLFWSGFSIKNTNKVLNNEQKVFPKVKGEFWSHLFVGVKFIVPASVYVAAICLLSLAIIVLTFAYIAISGVSIEKLQTSVSISLLALYAIPYFICIFLPIVFIPLYVSFAKEYKIGDFFKLNNFSIFKTGVIEFVYAYVLNMIFGIFVSILAITFIFAILTVFLIIAALIYLASNSAIAVALVSTPAVLLSIYAYFIVIWLCVLFYQSLTTQAYNYALLENSKEEKTKREAKEYVIAFLLLLLLTLSQLGQYAMQQTFNSYIKKMPTAEKQLPVDMATKKAG